MTQDEEAAIWNWPCFNPPGLLVGPLPYKRNCFGRWVVDYSHPGVAQRVAIQVDFVEDVLGNRRRN